MVIIAAIGILHACELGTLTIDEAHAYLFNPHTLESLKEIRASSQLIDFFHKALFLEDVESLFSKTKLYETIVELKQDAFNLLLLYNFEPSIENKWVEVSGI